MLQSGLKFEVGLIAFKFDLERETDGRGKENIGESSALQWQEGGGEETTSYWGRRWFRQQR